jgi:chloramphenicol 3-O-phosphotransferase
MIIMLNGSFGIGKTTVARLLRRALPGSSIYDPEWFGVGLLRLGKWFRVKRWQTDDFQNIPLWRKSVAAGIQLCRKFASGPVIVPMAFSNRNYLSEILTDLNERGDGPRLFCLIADLETVEQRWAERKLERNNRETIWAARRIRECIAAHRDSYFGEAIDTKNRTAREVTEDILQRLKSGIVDRDSILGG